MLRSVFGKTLRDQRRWLLGWAIVVAAVGVLYASFWPLMVTPEMKAAMDAFPPALLEALNFTDIATAAGYVGSTTFGLLGPALTIVFAAAVGGSAIAGEEESGRLDLILAHPVSRWSVALQRFAAIVVQMAVVGTILALALIAISGPAQLDEIGPANLAAASFHLAVFGIFFAALALGVGAATGKRSLVYAAVALVAIGGFLANNLAPLVDEIAFLRDFSPFHFYQGGEPLKNGLQAADLGVLVAASLVLVGLGGLVFHRRDIAV
ncbi:MAG TPA: ABC transporter permease subunit [Patescibacteria group bacterium]|nr:ABC transporter permease subunit [Patescibacteria group bacterium]